MKLAIFGTLCVASYVAAETHYVQAYDTYFEPDVIYAEPGDTVIWQYVNGYPHTVTSGIPDPCPDGTPDGWFDGVLSSPGDEVIWEVPAEAPAEVTYYCKPHCMMGMTGTIYVEGDEPRLTIGIADISTCDFLYSEGSGQARIEIESGEYGTSSFAWGVEAEDMDINVDVVSCGNVFIHSASEDTTEELSCGTHTFTLVAGQKYMFHGYCANGDEFDFVMEWEQETDTGGGVIMGVQGINANLSASGDSITFRAQGDGAITLSMTAPAEKTAIPMAVVANVLSDTLTLPASGEEGSVSIPTGKTHTIALNGDGAGMGMLIVQMGGGDGDSDDGGGNEPCPGDANQDGVVDVNDLLECIAYFGSTCP